jgi:hypothetical protein
MSIEPPKVIAIDHDDYHAEFVGKTGDGKQFFLTTPFDPASPTNPGNEFVALYLFDKNGDLIEALIDEFGPRNKMDIDARDALCKKRLDDLGDIELGRIEIAPFSIEKFGITFGLVPNEMDDEDDELSFSLMPGDYMAFYEPWESGDYDT